MHVFFLLGGLATTTAHANGQTTHLWITDAAVSHIEDNSLLALLTTQSEPLRVGTMFPDGGYAVDHGYGEAAHWEPFQDAYRDWIRDHYPDLADPEAAPHIAFYLGLASHGMADQLFDSMYMERSRIYDAEHGWADQNTSLDTAQDIVFAALTGAQVVPNGSIPEHFPDLFARLGIDVDMDTLVAGQSRLELAVNGVGGLSTVDATVAINEEAFPWGCSHLLDESVPGAPPFEAEVVARYWTHLWNEIHGELGVLEVIASFPLANSLGHSPDPGDIESRLSLVFSRGLTDEDVHEDHFRVHTTERDLAVDLDLFYGNHSHVVNIEPEAGWTENSEHVLTISDALVATDGRTMGTPHTQIFSTVPVPSANPIDTASPALDATNKDGCSCTVQTLPTGKWGLWILAALLGFRRRTV
jgi:hypothetical protein